jgi:hypothetical protein
MWVYVYQSCQPQSNIDSHGLTSNSFVQVIQSVPVSFTIIDGQSFKDKDGNCWIYNGRFESDYIPDLDSNFYVIRNSGNYFDTANSTIYSSCVDCLTPSVPEKQTVISVYGYMQPCTGGGIDTNMGASIILDNPVKIDTTFDIYVYYQEGNNRCNTPYNNNNSTYFTITIAAGEKEGGIGDPCSYGQQFSSGAQICGACVASSTNTNINFGNYGC